MANHLLEQKEYSTCKLLLDELSRVVGEELRLRKELLATGVRDVSDQVTLPKNRLDQLDERSASYDDQRCCHGCNHVCFLSGVACTCSETKVSCLRHSHYMCRCTPDKRYLLIWCSDAELNGTVERVRQHCEKLRRAEGGTKPEDNQKCPASNVCSTGDSQTEGLAPGVGRDAEIHKYHQISTDPVTEESFLRDTGTQVKTSKPPLCSRPSSSFRVVSSSSTEPEEDRNLSDDTPADNRSPDSPASFRVVSSTSSVASDNVTEASSDASGNSE